MSRKASMRERPPRKLDEKERLALGFLLSQAVEEDGWELRGVRGWRFAEELDRELKRTGMADTLRDLAYHHLVDRVSFDRMLRHRGQQLYRANAAGARALAAQLGTEPLLVPPPLPEAGAARTPLHLTRNAWLVLDALVRRRLSGLGLGWKGEKGWMTGAEIHAAAHLSSADLELGWLTRLELVEQGSAEDGGKPVTVYRATLAGRALRVAGTAPLPEAKVVYVETVSGKVARVRGGTTPMRREAHAVGGARMGIGGRARKHPASAAGRAQA
jgi:hypothetical protein